MQTDWVKIRTDIYRDPKVLKMADHLMEFALRDSNVTRNVTRCATVGALVAIWGAIRQHGAPIALERASIDESETSSALLRGASLSHLDDIADLPGIGAAMESVGWVEVVGEDLEFPAFFGENNTDPKASQRSAAAERQRRYRERKREVLAKHRVDTRREFFLIEVELAVQAVINASLPDVCCCLSVTDSVNVLERRHHDILATAYPETPFEQRLEKCFVDLRNANK